ncbi:MAG TPA: PilZ domain-containing protein [Thermoanaerobaculia bacterium]|nr:PilZ domain-containing protein [Thermoanaerobaculia bacterium]
MTTDVTARSLRSADRFVMTPPLEAEHGGTPVLLSDLSLKGARFKHDEVMPGSRKAILQFRVPHRDLPIRVESEILWTQPTGEGRRFFSGARILGASEFIESVLRDLMDRGHCCRIEELRAADRFFVSPPFDASFDGREVLVDNASARGARIFSATELPPGSEGIFRFRLPDLPFEVASAARVAWTRLRSITPGESRLFASGLAITEKPELMRLAIGHLCEAGRASLDTHSLELKLKIIRARARQQASNLGVGQRANGIPVEQALLIRGVCEELRANPEEAAFWNRRARITINENVGTPAVAPIAGSLEAVAVWEFLNRSIDASIIARSLDDGPEVTEEYSLKG